MEHIITSDLNDLPPPWIAIPGLSVDDPANQGLAEMYIKLNWLPFWQTLTADAKARYLDQWSTSPEWRKAIATRYDDAGVDAEADARESEEWARARRLETPVRQSSWARFWRRIRP